MKKSARMQELIETLDAKDSAGFDPCYLGYFECFNSQRYYEAHDVLEHLWLKDGSHSPDYAFYKGLIQMAGGFVHLKLHHAHPNHPKHGRRLHPARRLFLLAMENLHRYAPTHHGIDLSVSVALCKRFVLLIDQSDFSLNPWNPTTAPLLPFPEMPAS